MFLRETNFFFFPLRFLLFSARYLPSSVIVPLLEPPLLLERGCEEAEDRESPGPVGGFGVGDGDGVRVGDVLLEVEELPD